MGHVVEKIDAPLKNLRPEIGGPRNYTKRRDAMRSPRPNVILHVVELDVFDFLRFWGLQLEHQVRACASREMPCDVFLYVTTLPLDADFEGFEICGDPLNLLEVVQPVDEP